MMCRMGIPSQSGRVAIVTGATGGLGSVVARSLAEAGAEVILAVRDPGRGEELRRTIPGDVSVRRLDLSDLESGREFAPGAPPGANRRIHTGGTMGVRAALALQDPGRQSAATYYGTSRAATRPL